MSEVIRGPVIRQFNIYDTSKPSGERLQKIHQIGAKAENVLIELEGQDPISVQEALQGSTSISQGLENITTSGQIIYSDKINNSISANPQYNLETLDKANSIQFTLQDYKNSSNSLIPIGAVYVGKDPQNSANNLFYTSLRDFNCTITVGGQRLVLDKTYRTQSTNTAYSNIQIDITDTLQEPSNYCFIVNNSESSSRTIGKANTSLGKIFDIYYKKVQLGKEKRSGKNLSLIDLIYPIGSIYITTNETPPSLLFGGRWEKKEGRFLLGATQGDIPAWFNTKTGGEATHILTPSETAIRNHTHSINEHSHSMKHAHDMDGSIWSSGSGGTKSAYTGTQKRKTKKRTTGDSPANTGKTTLTTNNPTESNGAAHNNMPPFLAVNIWERTA